MLHLTARWVVPVDREPIADGEVSVDSSGAIEYVGPRRPEAERPGVARDMGNSVLLPGLVDSHTHLEYNLMRGFLEDMPFFPWVRALTAAKALASPDDWLVSARLAALECIAGGITTVGDNTDSGVTARAAAEHGLRAVIFQEVFGPDPRADIEPILADLDAKLHALAAYSSARVRLGVSPHALYTVRPDLMRAVTRYCDRNGGLRTSIHLAESAAEGALTNWGAGPFAEMYARRDIRWTAPGVSPTRMLADLGAVGPCTLCVHCVHQDDTDIQIIEQAGAAIAHCPKSNAKLGAGVAPLTRWLAAPSLKTRVGLGTDSAVSNNTLDLFEEMRFGLFLQRAVHESVDLSASDMLRMATLAGAAALGLDSVTGSLTPGKRADIIAVRIGTPHACPADDPCAALVYSARASDVCLTLVDGRILYDDGRYAGGDPSAIVADLRRRRAALARNFAASDEQRPRS